MPGSRDRRREVELERVLGAPALFATVYGNVGSSINYALGVTAAFALGLTPLVFVIAGLILACTRLTCAEGTARRRLRPSERSVRGSRGRVPRRSFRRMRARRASPLQSLP